MSGADPAAARAADRRFRLASSGVALGAVFVLLALALVPLSLAARQSPLVNGGESLGTIPFAAVGLVIARRQPRNPIGWLLLGIATCLLLSVDSGFYAVISYRLGHHLPLAPVALLLYQLWGPALVLFALVILLFPDGSLPSRSSRIILVVFLAALILFTAALIAAVTEAVIGRNIRLDAFDGLVAIDRPTGWFAVTQVVFALIGAPFMVWCVARQIVGWPAASRSRPSALSSGCWRRGTPAAGSARWPTSSRAESSRCPSPSGWRC